MLQSVDKQKMTLAAYTYIRLKYGSIAMYVCLAPINLIMVGNILLPVEEIEKVILKLLEA